MKKIICGPLSSVDVTAQVYAVKGQSAILPCSFTLQSYEGPISVIWRTDEIFRGPVIFQCINDTAGKRYNCTTEKNNEGRYQLAGDLRQNNASLLIEKVSYQDSKKYFCRVEITDENAICGYTSQNGTQLNVTAPPSILNLTVTINSSLGYRILRCIVEGEPLPNITWIGPGNAELHKESNNITATPFPEEHQIMSEIHSVIQEGNYTCKAVNNHGHDEKSSNIKQNGNLMPTDKHSPPVITYLVIVILTMMGVLLVIAVYWRRRGTSNSGTSPVNAHVQMNQRQQEGGNPNECTHADIVFTNSSKDENRYT
ncbi:sialic acid-binding Ig-like lectin 15 [Latimeria chalumnae]|uniref:sialic acid-binding Ig-like lectin 15 n=1 Tax=Latimeria chalumnae TaxID=7897 RepID=UPI00313DEB64